METIRLPTKILFFPVVQWGPSWQQPPLPVHSHSHHHRQDLTIACDNSHKLGHTEFHLCGVLLVLRQLFMNLPELPPWDWLKVFLWSRSWRDTNISEPLYFIWLEERFLVTFNKSWGLSESPSKTPLHWLSGKLLITESLKEISSL